MKKSSIDMPISLADAARLVGKSQTWIRKLVNGGYMKQLEHGRYRPCEVAQGVLRFMTDEQRRASKSGTLAQVQTARAREIELRIARADHEIVDLDEAIGTLDEVVGALKADLDGLGASVSRDAALRGQIEARVDEILRRASDRLQQKARALRASGTAVDADGEDDARPMGGEEPAISA
jgi:uncharacterized membrane protein YccC